MKKNTIKRIYNYLLNISVFLAIISIYCKIVTININIYEISDIVFMSIFAIGILIAIFIHLLLRHLFQK